MGRKFTWKGDAVLKDFRRGIGEGLAEFGLRIEAKAKGELKKGRGVITGTLRRSIHVATPGYNWSGDNVPPAEGTPDRGGELVKPKIAGGRVWVEVGSGMEYALAVHDGHHSFSGYKYITGPVDDLSPDLPRILTSHLSRYQKGAG